jgi:hypothetical protein
MVEALQQRNLLFNGQNSLVEEASLITWLATCWSSLEDLQVVSSKRSLEVTKRHSISRSTMAALRIPYEDQRNHHTVKSIIEDRDKLSMALIFSNRS